MRKFLGLIGYIAVFGAMAYYGSSLKRGQEAERIIREVKLEQRVPSLAVIPVDMLDAMVIPAAVHFRAKARQATGDWTALESKNWLLLNGSNVEGLCHALQPYVSGLGRLVAGTSLDALNLYMSAVKGRTVNVGVYIPRYTGKPLDLNACMGYSFDEQTGTLKVGTRTVALLASDQAGMWDVEQP